MDDEYCLQVLQSREMVLDSYDGKLSNTNGMFQSPALRKFASYWKSSERIQNALQ